MGRYYRTGHEYSEPAYSEFGTIYVPGESPGFGVSGEPERVGYVDSSGTVYRYTGDTVLREKRLGRVDGAGIIYDTGGFQVGYVKAMKEGIAFDLGTSLDLLNKGAGHLFNQNANYYRQPTACAAG